MLISLKNNIAFLAMTKTGSTAIEAALAPHCEIAFTGNPRAKHMNAGRFERFMRPYLEAIDHGSVETMCLVREPIDWLASWWRYRQRDEIAGSIRSTKGVSFVEFIQKYAAGLDPAGDIGQPSRFVSSGGKPAVTYLFRYEDMATALEFLGARFGQKLTLDRRNVSPANEYALSEDQRREVTKFLAPEYELYEAIPRP